MLIESDHGPAEVERQLENFYKEVSVNGTAVSPKFPNLESPGELVRKGQVGRTWDRFTIHRIEGFRMELKLSPGPVTLSIEPAEDVSLKVLSLVKEGIWQAVTSKTLLFSATGEDEFRISLLGLTNKYFALIAHFPQKSKISDLEIGLEEVVVN